MCVPARDLFCPTRSPPGSSTPSTRSHPRRVPSAFSSVAPWVVRPKYWPATTSTRIRDATGPSWLVDQVATSPSTSRTWSAQSPVEGQPAISVLLHAAVEQDRGLIHDKVSLVDATRRDCLRPNVRALAHSLTSVWQFSVKRVARQM